MKRRSKINPRAAKQMFSRTARYVHPRNAPVVLMRGGIRL